MLLESLGSANREVALGIVDRNRRLLEHSSLHPYKNLGDKELTARIFLPKDWCDTDRRSCMIFFHSSQWDHGNITQFAPHAVLFASRGAVCILIEYRTGAAHGQAPLQAMADARTAIRWVRQNETALGIDPDKLVASGGSCGAHAAVTAAMCGEEFDDPEDQLHVSCIPNALVLFSPVLDISRHGFGLDQFPDKTTAKKANPLRCIRAGLPPMMLFHGSADASVPVGGTIKFERKMKRKKNNCQLVEYGGQPHSFFNFNVNDRLYYATIDAADGFLVEIGILDHDPDVEAAREYLH